MQISPSSFPVAVTVAVVLCCFAIQLEAAVEQENGRQEKKAHLVKKHLKRLKKQDGAIKLVGGRGEFEGIYFTQINTGSNGCTTGEKESK